ncbi:hypothetical protein [Candidatus Cytomitobacter primus]|uniref:DUF3168 domain-containing protein n=1 Tax=Candidatus Cytomitobacter primus TaxID=2066024 RepID=A0A5C0UGV0_9PROT|nr:hypothetical protein [Candidatus Cytomitobacter primus]QEK38522.1 hypothetical protein FZC34_01195 [Candidatus Cytomitobacter primus]
MNQNIQTYNQIIINIAQSIFPSSYIGLENHSAQNALNIEISDYAEDYEEISISYHATLRKFKINNTYYEDFLKLQSAICKIKGCQYCNIDIKKSTIQFKIIAKKLPTKDIYEAKFKI